MNLKVGRSSEYQLGNRPGNQMDEGHNIYRKWMEVHRIRCVGMWIIKMSDANSLDKKASQHVATLSNIDQSNDCNFEKCFDINFCLPDRAPDYIYRLTFCIISITMKICIIHT